MLAVSLPICFRHLSGHFTAGICSYLSFAKIQRCKMAENTCTRFCRPCQKRVQRPDKPSERQSKQAPAPNSHSKRDFTAPAWWRTTSPWTSQPHRSCQSHTTLIHGGPTSDRRDDSCASLAETLTCASTTRIASMFQIWTPCFKGN